MLTRDEGQRRISTVTIGLAAASVAGTLAVGAAAWAKESQDDAGTSTPTPTSTAGTTPGTPAPDATAAPPAASQPASPDLTGPGGEVTDGSSGSDKPGHATSGGS